ncbi:uncharacterized protein G2W53_035355 [Senna tora]|uniref:Uncharacterized protein n=1 Tax=Senna tora TaxID=362788 RepID=A0A834W3X0_9FABA|nr:uncharacterized protein G2W53_035355 [Senna tora]
MASRAIANDTLYMNMTLSNLISKLREAEVEKMKLKGEVEKKGYVFKGDETVEFEMLAKFFLVVPPSSSHLPTISYISPQPPSPSCVALLYFHLSQHLKLYRLVSFRDINYLLFFSTSPFSFIFSTLAS